MPQHYPTLGETCPACGIDPTRTIRKRLAAPCQLCKAYQHRHKNYRERPWLTMRQWLRTASKRATRVRYWPLFHAGRPYEDKCPDCGRDIGYPRGKAAIRCAQCTYVRLTLKRYRRRQTPIHDVVQRPLFAWWQRHSGGGAGGEDEFDAVEPQRAPSPPKGNAKPAPVTVRLRKRAKVEGVQWPSVGCVSNPQPVHIPLPHPHIPLPHPHIPLLRDGEWYIELAACGWARCL